jgi:hypothetical protein
MHPSRFLAAALCGLLSGGSALAQNIALNKTVIVSSTEGPGLDGFFAVDGQGRAAQINAQGQCSGSCTRWSSDYSDPQNIVIDLQANFQVAQVVIYWEVASGSTSRSTFPLTGAISRRSARSQTTAVSATSSTFRPSPPGTCG